MALAVRAGTFTANTVTGNQVVSLATGGNWPASTTPKLVMFFASGQTVDGAAALGAGMVGAAAAVAGQWVLSQASDANPAAAVNSGQSARTNACIVLLSAGTPTVQSVATFVSFGADQFTINWTTQTSPPAGRDIFYIAYGGADLTNVAVGASTIPTATGNQAIAPTGFTGVTPDALITCTPYQLASPTEAVHSHFGLGLATRLPSTAQGVAAMLEVDASTAIDTQRLFRADACVGGGEAAAAGVVRGSLNSWDANGFTINWADVTATASMVWYYVALKGGTWQTGVETEQTTNTTKVTSLSGFTSLTPKGLVLVGSNGTADTATTGDAADGDCVIAMGVSDGTNEGAIANAQINGSSAAANSFAVRYQNATAALGLIKTPTATSATVAGTADATFQSGQFTLTWAATDGTARRFLYLAAGDAPPPVYTLSGGGTVPVPAGSGAGLAVVNPGQVAIANNVPAATGLGHQSHLFYAVNSARWWMLWIDSAATTSLKSSYSSDLVTWTPGATLTLANNHNNEGRNFAAVYRNIAGNDVVHLKVWTQISATSKTSHHVRGTIAGTTLTWGTYTSVETDANNWTPGTTVAAVSLDSANRPIHGSVVWGDLHALRATNTDAGTAWTAGFGAAATLATFVSECSTAAIFDIGATNVLIVSDDGSTTGGTYTFVNLDWFKWTGSWSAAANVRGTNITAASKADWGAAARTTGDVHLVLRNGTQLEHYRYNGTSWGTVTNLPAQTSKAGSGIFLASDGTDVYLFVIDSAAGNAVKYCVWSGGAGTWGSWATLVATSATRNAIGGYPAAANGALGVAWTEGSATPYTIMAASLALAATFTLSGSGTVPAPSGSGAGLAVTAPSYTLSGAGTVPVPSGSGTGLTYRSLGNLSGTGTIPAPGGSGTGLTNTSPVYTLSGAGTVPAPSGSGVGLTNTNPAYTLSGAGGVPVPVGSGTGLTFAVPVYTLSGSGTLPAPSGSGTGLTYKSASVLSGSGTVPAPAGSGTGLTFAVPVYTLSGAATLPAPSGSGTGLTYVSASILSGGATVPGPSGSGVGFVVTNPSYTLSGTGTVPAPGGSGAGLQFASAIYSLSGNATVPGPSGSGTGLTFAVPVYTLSGAGTIAAPGGSGSGLTFVAPVYRLSGNGTVPAPAGGGAGLVFVAPVYTLTGNGTIAAPVGSGTGLLVTNPASTLSGTATVAAPTGGGAGLVSSGAITALRTFAARARGTTFAATARGMALAARARALTFRGRDSAMPMWQADPTSTVEPSYATTAQDDETLTFDTTALLVGGGAPSAPSALCFVVTDNAPDPAFTLQDQPALGTGNLITQRVRGLAAGTTYRYRLTFTTGGNRRSMTTIIECVE